MTKVRYSPTEIAARGKEWYEKGIRQKVETTENLGKILVIDIETGEYEMDEDHVAATRRAQAKRPGHLLYGIRIGYPAVYKVGGRLRASNQ
ncbi:MAG TPA: hypothetical protein VFB21_17015 [Chthonomonadaceae bacterium]|nr:hypothetical protein [Chthonomonadaceae bacterium]